MKYSRGVKKAIAAVLILVMAGALAACGSGSGSESSSAASISKPALVSKVVQYDRDYSTDEVTWIEQSSYEYEYQDAYPVSEKLTESEHVRIQDFKYELEEGRPVRMTKYNPDTDLTDKTSYTKQGLVNRVKTYDNTGRRIGEKVFQYGNRDEYFTLVLHENIISPPEEKVVDHMEEVDSVIVTSENGLLRKTVNDGLFANYNDEEEKLWRRFDGTYTANYADNGIIDNTTAIFKTFPGSGNQYKFDVTIEDGRVTEVVRNCWVAADNEAAEDEEAATEEPVTEEAATEEPVSEEAVIEEAEIEASATEESADSEREGMWEPEVRFVFEYNDTEISPARYASMINYFLLEGGGNYYYYNWY